jgi:hypothetical protein
MTVTPQPKITKDAFHIERSHFLDGFAALEETLQRLGSSVSDDRLLKEIKALRLIRNDVVHAQLRFVQLEGQLQAIAINSQNAFDRARPARVLKVEDIKSLTGELARLKKDVEAA